MEYTGLILLLLWRIDIKTRKHFRKKYIIRFKLYNEKTKFLQQGEKNGAMIINGKNMLKIQAHFAIDIWEASLKEREDK